MKLPAGPVKNIVGYAVIPFQKGSTVSAQCWTALRGPAEQTEAGGRKSAAPGQGRRAYRPEQPVTQDLDELDRLEQLYDLDQQYSEYDKVAAQGHCDG